MKIARSNKENVSPYGGVVPILHKIKEYGIPQVIRKCLGSRKKQSKYSYEDIFISWILTSLCGGKRLDHITKLRKKLPIIKGIKMPAHDTLGRVLKQVAEESKTVRMTTNHGITYSEYTDNIELNRMLIQSTKRIGALKEGVKYTLDIDAMFIATECRGATRKVGNYPKIGFNPMICLINNLPVFVSMRNGDAGSRFQFLECLENCLNLLEEANIKVGKVISDAAGYHKETFEMLEKRGIKFITRFPYQVRMETFKSNLKKCNDWRPTEIKTAYHVWECEIADIPYKMHDRPESGHISPTWRVVAIRIPVSKGLDSPEELERKEQNKARLEKAFKRKGLKEKGKAYEDKNWKRNGGYEYKFFITNDHKSTSESIVTTYNKRGNSERQFSFMKNDFGWALPPFSNMNENGVFLIAGALANNIFRGIVKMFKKVLPYLRLNARLPEFRFVFVIVNCSLINKTYIFYNTDVEYEKIT